MSATDDIRVLLGEHGVKCEIHDTKKRKDTRWDFRGLSHAMFSEYRDGMTVFVMSGVLWTPEEAIAATVGDTDATPTRQDGVETCHVMTIGEFNGEGTEYYDVCSNCGYEFDDDPLNYCPNCGRRVVAE